MAMGCTTTLPGGLAGALLGGAPGHERRALHEIVELVIVPGDHAFGKDNERASGLGGELHRGLERLAVCALAVNAEDTQPRQQEALEFILLKEVPARDNVERAVDLVGQHAEHDGIGRAAVIRRQHHAVAGVERGAQALRMAEFHFHDAVALAQDAWDEETKNSPPQLAAPGSHEAVGLRNDDVLHFEPRLARDRSGSSGGREIQFS
jgi:hypothetical protein